jgi:TfoX/Sxy family transcriptional regulator of competence genes
MASDPEFVSFVEDQLSGTGEILAKKMFGEYGVYLDGVFFGLICDNRFFVKPTEGGRAFIGKPVEAPPYPGARNSFLIEDKLEDRDWVCELVKITVKELPPSKKKK